MKILSAAEIRMWDEYTIQHEPILSIDLMERAALKCVQWLTAKYPAAPSYGIYCGKGNNGGDGLAIARMLSGMNYQVSVHILEFGHIGTPDFQVNLARLHQLPGIAIHYIQTAEHLHAIPSGEVIIDALYGSGLNREIDGITSDLVSHINQSGCEVVSVDIPSGLYTDRSSQKTTCVKATHTLTFQCYKPAFLFAENAEMTGTIHVLDIGLHPGFPGQHSSRFEMTGLPFARSLHKKRNRFSHKGNYGHALLVAGSYGKIGAAVLAAKAALRSGAGLLTCHVPGCGYAILQISVPEAMVATDTNEQFITSIPETGRYESIGIGPGLGIAGETRLSITHLLEQYHGPLVLDADALNGLSAQPELLNQLPAGSILTPHPKEFDRLFGNTPDEFERAELAMKKATELQCVIILKGHHTLIATPGDKGFFNSTGNPGMATAGSGDVLTGILTGLLAQGYGSVEAAILGVYLHGLAGDIAATELSMESMVAGDIIGSLGKAFQLLQ